jgi:hypothetical protein
VDPDGIFYSDSNSQDIETLNKCLTIVDPENLDKHMKKLEQAAKDIGFFIGIAQKGFQHDAMMKKLMSFAYYGAFYVLKRKTASHNGQMFLHTLDDKTLSRMIQFPENKIIQRLMKVILPKVDIDKEFYIPISKPDELVDNSFEDDSIPFMVENKQGMNFHTSSSKYIKDDFVKVNVISYKDWKSVNWKKNR